MIRVVNIVPQAQSNETSQDSEPNITVNPARPRQVAITAFTPDPLGGANAPIYVSTDGGTNWALNTIVPSVAGSTFGTGDITLRFGGAPGEGWNLRAGDSFYAADIDNDGGDEIVVVSPDGKWIGVLDESGDGLAAAWLVRDWVNPPGGSGPSGWNLNQGDRFFVADIDGDDRHELIVVSPNGQWIGVLREAGGGLAASWIKNDWVNHPGGSGASGWDLKQGDRFFVADIDADNRDELIVVSPNGEWIGILREDNGGLSAGWIKYDWVNHPGGSGASGWNLNQPDRFFVADIDGDNRDELIVVSGNGQWIGILHEDSGGLSAGWIKNDWVNHPGGSGASGWDLKQGDQFIVADIDGDTRDEVIVVSPNGQWIGVLHEDSGGLSAGWIKNDWVNHPGGSGASGWDLRQGDRFFIADIDADSRDELVVVSPDGQWIGVFQESGGGLEATWLANDWVNHPGGSGPNGWDLKFGDRFFVSDVDADNRKEVLVSSPNGRWLALLRDSGSGLAATWIEADWVDPPGGAVGALLAGGILSAATRLRLQTLRTFDFTNPRRCRCSASGTTSTSPTPRPSVLAPARRRGRTSSTSGSTTSGQEAGVRRRSRPASTPARQHRPSPRSGSSAGRRAARTGLRSARRFIPTGRCTRCSPAGDLQQHDRRGTADVVVVRDDDWGRGANPFSALVDPGDNVAGMRVVTGMNFTFNFMAGQERRSCPLSIAVDPRDSDTVWVAWGDLVGTAPTLHVPRSTDRGETWTADLITIATPRTQRSPSSPTAPSASCTSSWPPPPPTTRWKTHFQRSPDGTTWADFMLATVPSGVPATPASLTWATTSGCSPSETRSTELQREQHAAGGELPPGRPIPPERGLATNNLRTSPTPTWRPRSIRSSSK